MPILVFMTRQVQPWYIRLVSIHTSELGHRMSSVQTSYSNKIYKYDNCDCNMTHVENIFAQRLQVNYTEEGQNFPIRRCFIRCTVQASQRTRILPVKLRDPLINLSCDVLYLSRVADSLSYRFCSSSRRTQ
jgi:hypothetical protein